VIEQQPAAGCKRHARAIATKMPRANQPLHATPVDNGLQFEAIGDGLDVDPFGKLQAHYERLVGDFDRRQWGFLGNSMTIARDTR